MSILSKGFNYANATTTISKLRKDISGVDRAVQHLPMETAEDIWQETCHILQHPKAQKNNTSNAKKDALVSLQEEKDVTILPTDKGDAIAITTTSEYDNNVRSDFRFSQQMNVFWDVAPYGLVEVY